MRIPINTGHPAMFNQLSVSQSTTGEVPHLQSQVKPTKLTFIDKQIARMPMPRRSSPLLLSNQPDADGSFQGSLESGSVSGSKTAKSASELMLQGLHQLGSIGIVNGGAKGPTPAAMDLLELNFGRSVAIACEDSPPNLLNDFPAEVTNVVATNQVGAVAAADTMFMLECSTLKTIENAKYIKPKGRVVVAGGELHQVAEQVAVLKQLRPDVELFGHAASDFALYAPTSVADPVQASLSTVAMLNGQEVTMVRPLCSEDAAWISEHVGCAVKSGTAIAAPFLIDGQLDRTMSQALLLSPSNGFRDAIEQLASLQSEPSPVVAAAVQAASKECSDIDSIHRAHHVPGGAFDAAKVGRQVTLLGPTVVYGANGSIGSALLKCLAQTGIPLCGVMRKPDRKFLRGFDAPQFNLVIADKVDSAFAARTAFITASTGWSKDAAGNIIFDRSRLLSANINILTPIFMQLPADVPLVMVISNPCSEMTYLGWLVRPDLSRNLFAHAGTDVTRQMNRVKDPRDTSKYGTAGPHSPLQVNWEMQKNRARNTAAKTLASIADSASSSAKPGTEKNAQPTGRIDPRIPMLGQMHQSRSRDKNSVTVPTAAASIFEAINIASGAPQSYARPLTLQEAEKLSTLMQRYGQKITVSEGIAPTLPRNAQCEIRWDMLTDAIEGVPNFPQKLFVALQAMEEGRFGLLNALVNKINTGRLDAEKINSQWIIEHRGLELADAIHAANK